MNFVGSLLDIYSNHCKMTYDLPPFINKSILIIYYRYQQIKRKSNKMLSLLTASQAQESIAKNLRTKRLGTGLTQAGLADRSGVSLPSLRRFEQSGNISLESLLKLLMTLNSLEQFVQSTEPISTEFSSIDDVLNDKKKKTPKKGWRK